LKTDISLYGRIRLFATINAGRQRAIFDLGPDPSVFIIYAGGNGFYFDDTIRAASPFAEALNAFMNRHRRLALKHHPDRGGREAAFVRLTRIYEMLRRC